MHRAPVSPQPGAGFGILILAAIVAFIIGDLEASKLLWIAVGVGLLLTALFNSPRPGKGA